MAVFFFRTVVLLCAFFQLGDFGQTSGGLQGALEGALEGSLEEYLEGTDANTLTGAFKLNEAGWVFTPFSSESEETSNEQNQETFSTASSTALLLPSSLQDIPQTAYAPRVEEHSTQRTLDFSITYTEGLKETGAPILENYEEWLWKSTKLRFQGGFKYCQNGDFLELLKEEEFERSLRIFSPFELAGILDYLKFKKGLFYPPLGDAQLVAFNVSVLEKVLVMRKAEDLNQIAAPSIDQVTKFFYNFSRMSITPQTINCIFVENLASVMLVYFELQKCLMEPSPFTPENKLRTIRKNYQLLLQKARQEFFLGVEYDLYDLYESLDFSSYSQRSYTGH